MSTNFCEHPTYGTDGKNTHILRLTTMFKAWGRRADFLVGLPGPSFSAHMRDYKFLWGYEPEETLLAENIPEVYAHQQLHHVKPMADFGHRVAEHYLGNVLTLIEKYLKRGCSLDVDGDGVAKPGTLEIPLAALDKKYPRQLRFMGIAGASQSGVGTQNTNGLSLLEYARQIEPVLPKGPTTCGGPNRGKLIHLLKDIMPMAMTAAFPHHNFESIRYTGTCPMWVSVLTPAER